MKKTVAVLAACVTAATSVAVAVPALAYDRDAYGRAAESMIERSDIPKVLGDFKKNLGFSAYASSSRIFVCDVPQADPNVPDVAIYMPGAKYSFNGSYQGKGKNDPVTIDVAVNQYASASDAIDAFSALKKNIKKCSGSGSNTWTDEDGNTTTYSTELTNGVVPAVTTTGVESLFVSNNSLQETTPGDSRFLNDDYSVYSLVDDVVIVTEYSANTNANLTTKQRKAVNQVAFNAETRWLS
jgi:hypothetical protein